MAESVYRPKPFIPVQRQFVAGEEIETFFQEMKKDFASDEETTIRKALFLYQSCVDAIKVGSRIVVVDDDFNLITEVKGII